MAILVADCASKMFGEKRVLTAGSLRATAGQVRVMFGRNGSGKTTLLKIAAGLMQADTGRVLFDDEILERPTLSRMANLGVFYLPDHDLLSRAFSVGKQLEFFEHRYQSRSVADAARIAHVERLLDRKPGSLSGGELRRAELAVALVRRPRCLLADEPYRGVAPVDHDALSDIFHEMAQDGCAVVITGHDVPSLLDLADHVTWCSSGTTHELGPPEIAAQHESFQRDYLMANPFSS